MGQIYANGNGYPLPETASLSSVPDFAECFLLGARQRGYLPSAREKALGKQLALGKEVVCRVPSTRQTITLGKGQVCRVSGTQQTGTLGKGTPPLTAAAAINPLPSVFSWHSAKRWFAECHFLTLGKPYFFQFWPPNFFCSPHTIPGTPCSNVAYFLDFFYISLINFI